jgi:2,3-bisphosphoglycerate-dependent phosphoglycerate mutase
MKIFLIASTELSNNIVFTNETDIEIKKKFRTLNPKGDMVSKKLAKMEEFDNIEAIYSDMSFGSIELAKNLAYEKDLLINVNKKIYDCKIGNLEGKSIKMLSYFQERNFDFKLEKGESLNECSKRVTAFIDEVLEDGYNQVAVFMPKRCILAYLINYIEVGYNLDESLVLTQNDKIILDNTGQLCNIYEITYKGKEFVDIKNLSINN